LSGSVRTSSAGAVGVLVVGVLVVGVLVVGVLVVGVTVVGVLVVGVTVVGVLVVGVTVVGVIVGDFIITNAATAAPISKNNRIKTAMIIPVLELFLGIIYGGC